MNTLSKCILSLSFIIAIQSAAVADHPDELLGDAASALIAARTFSADFSTTTTDAKGHIIHKMGTVRLMKPNFVRLDMWTINSNDKAGKPRLGAPHEIRASDGKFYWRILPDGTFTKVSADLQVIDDFDDLAPFSGFFDSFKLYLAQPAPRLSINRTARIDGGPCKIFDLKPAKGSGKAMGQVAFGPDHVIRLLKLAAPPGSEVELRHVKLDAPFKESDFRFARPVFAKVLKKDLNPPQVAAGGGAPESAMPEEPPVLANGKVAPDFTVADKSGKPVKLSDYKGKVVVLDFWATWCGPCQESMPHTNAVARKFKDKGVVVLAVNVSDTKQAFDAWLPQHKEYNAIVFAIDSHDPGKDAGAVLYKVTGIPTQFVIGKNGKIVKSFVGYGGPTTDLTNAIKSALAADVKE